MGYRLLRLENIFGQQELYKLEYNGKCQFVDFCRLIEAEGNYADELDIIQARLEAIANGQLLPRNKFRDITPRKDKHKEYEIKTANLRIYLTKVEKVGKLIILGGQKNSQKRDIKRFRTIKKDFFNTLN